MIRRFVFCCCFIASCWGFRRFWCVWIAIQQREREREKRTSQCILMCLCVLKSLLWVSAVLSLLTRWMLGKWRRITLPLDTSQAPFTTVDTFFFFLVLCLLFTAIFSFFPLPSAGIVFLFITYYLIVLMSLKRLSSCIAFSGASSPSSASFCVNEKRQRRLYDEKTTTLKSCYLKRSLVFLKGNEWKKEIHSLSLSLLNCR